MDAFFNADQQHSLESLFREMMQTAKEDDSPLVYTVKQAADKLQISKSKTYELARQKKIPSVKIDGRVMIPRQRLEDWLNEQAE